MNDDRVSDYPGRAENISSLETGTPIKHRPVQESSNQQYHDISTAEPKAQHKSSSPPQARRRFDEDLKSVPASPAGRLQDDTNQPNNEHNTPRFKLADENRRIVKDYFHDLLVYINKNDATLANDHDGELTYFMRQMPPEEVDMTFTTWVESKLDKIKMDFARDCEEKMRTLRMDFERTQDFISSLEDEETITSIARRLNLL